MKRDRSSKPENWEQDPLWDLLRQTPRTKPSPTFAADVLRAARLEPTTESWWKRFWLPITVGGLATAATAILATVLILQQPQDPASLIVESPAAALPAADSLDSLDDIVQAEALLAAAENPAEFNDLELVSLIGF